MSQIFLTGSSGFIGSRLLPQLQKLGHTVITDKKSMYEPHDLIINLAAVTTISPEFSGEMFDLNVAFVEKLFTHPAKIIYASSCSEMFLTNPYAYTKRYAEFCGARHGNAIGLRFFNVYGPNNSKGIVKYLMDQPDGAKIIIRGPELVRDYIHVDDVVRNILFYADIANIDHHSRVYDVGTKIGMETMELVNLYQKVSGKTFDISIEEAGTNEPKEMVSSLCVPDALSLEDGLIKTINESK